MNDESESRGRSRFASATTIALALIASYIVSVGPVVAFCRSEFCNVVFKKYRSREKLLVKLYEPLIQSAESVRAEPVIYWYVGLLGEANRDYLMRVRAHELLTIAQDALEAGDTGKARSMTLRAGKINYDYDVLGLTPEYLFALIERAEGSQAATAHLIIVTEK